MKASFLYPLSSIIASLLPLGMAQQQHHEHQHEHGEACTSEHEHQHEHGEACTSEHDHDHDHDHAAPIIIKLDAKARSVIALRTEPVPAAGDIISSSLYGYLSLPPYALSDYTMPVAGRIELMVKSAQVVEAGQPLFTIESPELASSIMAQKQIEASLTRCISDIATMSGRIAKLREAGTRKVELEEQLAFKESEQRELESQLANSKRGLALMSMGAEIEEQEQRYFLLVRAKQAGKVRTVGVSQGSWGERGTSIVSMSQESAMEIMAQLYASDQPKFSHARAIVPVGQQNIMVEGSLRIAEQIDPIKQTRAVYFKPTHLPEGVQMGQLCRIDLFLPKLDGEQGMSIPDSAIVKVGLDDMVFIDHGEGIFEAKKVHAGQSRQGMTPVTGLQAGQQLVVKGAYEFKFVMPSEGDKKVTGHFHADGKFHEGEDH
ncbi:MAG: efflux RND transporter periplasmic adaptor subunit [Akkermansia sp.]